LEIVDVHGVGPEGAGVPGRTFDGNPHFTEEFYEQVYIEDIGNVGDGDGLGSEEYCGDDLKGFVLGSLGGDGAGQLFSARYFK